MKTSSAASKKKTVRVYKTKKAHFPIVAIGASAGGLEAVTQLLQNLPANTGMAFVYIQHLSPDYKNMLAVLLSKSTLMKVEEAQNGIKMKPNWFYIIPPNKEMTVSDGHIKLSPRKKGELNLPIDAFFTSLAEKHKDQTVGIILSGSASDGTRGLKAIRNAGGYTFAQDDTAKFDSMPKSAIAEGIVDFILPPKKIALKLATLNKDGFARKDQWTEDDIDNSNPDLRNILLQLYKRTGIDFSHYKMNTIKRRILRRMPLNKAKTLKSYEALLKKNEEELDLLHKDLLINVTDFFRDTEASQFIKISILPRLLRSKTNGEALRIWVPACSTGEEAYSLAMTILEIQDSKSSKVPVQIFATDLSETAINKARNGEYPERDLQSVSPKRLQRFFSKYKNSYRIAKSLRDICVFAQHNILIDPPFSHIDLISCCNLLIYLDANAQKKVMSTFHYALNDNGYLVLGKSETIGGATQLFAPINKKFKIYSRKKNGSIRAIPEVTRNRQGVNFEPRRVSAQAKNTIPGTIAHIDQAIDSFLLAHYMPASVVINEDMEILQFRGTTTPFLRHASGKASFNILKMANPDFAFELRHAIYTAIKTKKTFRKNHIELKTSTGVRALDLEVSPMKIEGEDPLLIVLFHEHALAELHAGTTTKGKAGKTVVVGNRTKDQQIIRLEEELSNLWAAMHALSDDQESVIEELQSANEEVGSNNEELRTLNEELETSKEEIESTNEELSSTNAELLAANEQMAELNTYSQAVLATIHNPMLVLDKALHIKSANQQFLKKFQLSETATLGTVLFNLNNKQWDIPQLHEMFDTIFSKNKSVQNFNLTFRFKNGGEKTLLLNANRIVQKNNNEQLILLAIEDITDEANLRASEKQLLNDLKVVNQLLEGKNKELNSFTYIASHDLQEPLRKIHIFVTELVKMEQHHLSASAKDYFQRIQNAAKRMQKLIEDLLAYSKTSVEERKFEKTNLNTLLEEVKKELLDKIEDKKAKIESNDLGRPEVIPFQFHQLLHNLVSNALKFAKPNVTPVIKIKSAVIKSNKLPKSKYDTAASAHYYHLSVSDNGIGFSHEYKDRIFEVFQRLHSVDEYMGTGIGLSICKKIVENHHGLITASGRLNRGSRFDIYIPVR